VREPKATTSSANISADTKHQHKLKCKPN